MSPGGDHPSLLVQNVGTLLSGDLEAPVLDADAVLIVDGRIAGIGTRADFGRADRTIDAQGTTVAPGLIDTHCHVTVGDFTPRQNTVGFLASYVHGGITQVVSPGEIHVPGRPHDRAGVKALAVLAQRVWSSYRPNGMKVLGGSVVLEPVLRDEDLAEIAGEGVRLAKFGFGQYENPLDGVPQVRGAQAAGMTVMCHTGGASIPGCRPIGTEEILALRPDVCGHVNGGPTSLEDDGVRRIVFETPLVLQLVQAGSLRSSLVILDAVLARGCPERVIIGSDTPTGTGVMPLGMLKTVAELSSLASVDPAIVWAWASGNAAGVYGLDGGRIEVGRAADLCVCDAPWGSPAHDAVGALERGDLPGISAVIIDGTVRALRSRNTPAPARSAVVEPPLGELPFATHVS